MKELLIKVRDYIPVEPCFFGMCGSAFEMADKFMISSDEYNLLMKYFKDNKPKKENLDEDEHGYWWEVKSKEPRIEWLNEQINSL
jgi:hypothetical protein